MLLIDLEVVWVVGWRDFDRVGVERWVDVFVGDDWDVLVG